MKKRPKSIILISLFYFSIAPATAFYFLANSGWNFVTAYQSLPTVNLIVGLVSLVIGLGVWFIRPWGYFTFLAASIFATGYLLNDFFDDPSVHNYFGFSAFALLLAVLGYFQQKHIAAPYFNPNVRWWETAQRYKAGPQIQVSMNGSQKELFLMDLSMSGCFVGSEKPLDTESIVYLRIHSAVDSFPVMSRIVRASKIPKGYGMMFLEMSASEKRRLQKMLETLRGSEVNRDIIGETQIEAA